MSREVSQIPLLSFEPGEGGAPPPIFDASTGICPVALPVSGEEALVFASRTSVIAALTSRDFGVAPLQDKHAVTGAVCQRPNGMLRLDKPDITNLKRQIGPFFSEAHIHQWHPQLEQAAAGLVKQMVEGPAEPDFNTAISNPFVATASSITAGIPNTEWTRLRDLSDATLALVESPQDIQRVKKAWDGLYDYCADYASRKPTEDQEGSILQDVISTFKDQGMDTEDLVPAFATVINGFPTPEPVISICALELMRRPEAIQACLEDPNLWGPTVEELLRFRAHFAAVLPRIALNDVVVDDVPIQKGQVVIPSLRAAAHDPQKVEKPDEFDITQKASRSIVFGSGSHLCPGAGLTRQWVKIALKEVFTTVPDIQLAIPEDQLEWQKGMLPVPEQMPVCWGG